ncbi:MAG: LacI family DNA-binding transcriptional regulator [Chloroflexi bacterium]|nr:LacI family DNA-binding transcriptional regulator [Chloroflexota bacterium]
MRGPSNPRPARIADVAREAGVSITTVSHVLSSKRPVSAQTRQAVLDAAQRLAYRPTVAARGLATGRTMALGLQFPMEGEHLLLNPYFPLLLGSLSAAAVHDGYSFVLLPARRSSEFPLESLLETQRLDGAILVDPSSTNDLLPLLRDYRVPVVTVGRYLGRARTHWVDNDHAIAIGRVLDHLAEQGYRRPALISLGHERYSYIVDIEDSFRTRTEAAGREPMVIRAEDLSERAGYDAAVTLLDRADRPDAIIAAVDRQAIGVLGAAEELGISVPDELGIVGEGDTVLARNANPPLTTIDPRAAELGAQAIAIIRQILDAGNRPGRMITLTVETRLVVRESTARSGAGPEISPAPAASP